jgi:TRAP-type C4-dicarboxylate transport system permease small subunit
MHTLTKFLDKTLSLLGIIALMLMMLHVVINALSRYFFRAPLDGTQELVNYWYLPILALVGFITAHCRNEHIAVSLVLDRLNARNYLEYVVFGRALGILLCVGWAWFGFTEAWSAMNVGKTAGVTDVILWPMYFLIPIVFTGLTVLFGLDIVRAFRGDLRPLENQAMDGDPLGDPAEVRAVESRVGA